MLKCPNFRKSFDLSLYCKRLQRSKILSLYLMQNHEKQTFINYIAYQSIILALEMHTLPMEAKPWVLTKILSSFLLAEALHTSGKTESKRFHFWWYISFYPTYFSGNSPVRILFQWFALNMLHNLKEDLTGRCYSKETASLSLAVALRFFPLLCLHCWGLVNKFSVLPTGSFVKYMLSKILVAILYIYWQ